MGLLWITYVMGLLMFVGLTGESKRIIAWEAEKNAGPFRCPQCKDPVILKKGSIYVHHFAHKPGAECPNAGESMYHLSIKRSVFLALKAYSGCDGCALERGLEHVRPDVSLRIGGKPVAIEIQLSNIDESEIERRLLRYTDMGIYCLWVTARDDIIATPKWERVSGRQYFYFARPRVITKKWERALHELYGGRVYYWRNGGIVIPAHFSFGRFKRDAYMEFARGGGPGVRMRSGGTKTLHIARDFRMGKSDIAGPNGPEILIWKDVLSDWWN